jgi:hypothetical protein
MSNHRPLSGKKLLATALLTGIVLMVASACTIQELIEDPAAAVEGYILSYVDTLLLTPVDSFMQEITLRLVDQIKW